MARYRNSSNSPSGSVKPHGGALGNPNQDQTDTSRKGAQWDHMPAAGSYLNGNMSRSEKDTGKVINPSGVPQGTAKGGPHWDHMPEKPK